MKRLNVKALIVIVAVGLLVGAGGALVYKFQSRRNADKLLAQIDLIDQEANPGRAAKTLERYLRYRPEDTDALARYGLLLADWAKSRQAGEAALLVLERVLGRDPGRDDVRRRAVQVALDLGRYPNVRVHATQLLESHPDDGELEAALGRAEEADGKPGAAAGLYEEAIAHDPTRVETYARLAQRLRTELNNPDRADEVMEALVAKNGQSHEAHLARAAYRLDYGARDEAAEDIARALELAPDDPRALLVAARVASERSDWDQARRLLERGLEKAPKSAEMYRELAAVEVQAGQLDRAEACLARGIKALPDDRELKWQLAGVQVERGELEQAEGRIVELEDLSYDKGKVGYLRARLQMARGQLTRAAQTLESVAPVLADQPGLARQANLMLASCYEQLGDADLQFDTYRRLVAADPGAAEARVRMAASLEDQGRVDEALIQYRMVADPTPEVRLAIARLMIRQNLKLTTDRRQWEEVEAALDEAARASPDEPGVPVLRAGMLAARDRHDEARALLEATRDAKPDRIEPWSALIELVGRGGKPEEVAALIDAAERRLGDRIELRVHRARYLVARGGSDAAGRLGELAEDLDKYSPEDRTWLLRRLAEAHSQVGDHAGALALWAPVADGRPEDLGAQLLAFDLALRADDASVQDWALGRIRAIEGDEGALWRHGRARQLVEKARGRAADRSGLPEARTLLTQAARRRPTWAQVPVLEAQIDELQGDTDAAIGHYRRAVELGERAPGIIRRTLQLLAEDRRYDEANLILAQLQDQSAISGEVRRLASEVFYRNEDYTRALELAEKAVSDGSTDYRDHLWLGQMRWAAGRRAEAEGPLRKAVALAGDDPTPRVTLVQYLVASGRKPEAERAVAEAEQKYSSEDHALFLASCYGAIGRKDRAEEQYRAALTAKPDDVDALRGAALFYIGMEQFPKAEPHLRTLIDPRTKVPAGEVAWARRTLAVGIATKGNPPRFDEALALVERNLQAGGGTGEDQHAKAVVLTTRPGRRREAITILENLLERQPLTPEMRFLLARLYATDGDWPRAREQMLSLLASREGNPQYPMHLATYARSLLERNQVDEARHWIETLEKLEPRTLRVVDLKARLLQAQGQGEEAVALLTAYARDNEAELASVAALLDELGQATAAEAMFRRLVARSGQPQSVLALAMHLARRGRTEEALDLCDEAWRTCPPGMVAVTSMAVLQSARANARLDDAQCRRVERRLEELVRRDTGAISFLFHLADLRSLQGRYADEEALHRRILAQDGRHDAALNNLAWLLALNDGQGAEALELVDRAIGLRGPAPHLLDTRAVVYLVMGRSDLAIKDLQEAVAEDSSAPLYFHLAQAYRMAGDRSAAAEALQKAQSLGLKADDLHPLEHAAYHRFLGELARR